MKRLSGISNFANTVFISPDDAREFMHTPHPNLEGKTPFNVAQTPDGARKVERLLADLRAHLLHRH
jgi:uncharacterized protein (DUF2384 family)